MELTKEEAKKLRDELLNSKVFCTRCKFYEECEWGSNACNAKYKVEINPLRPRIRTVFNPEEQNRENDCIYYQDSMWNKILKKIDVWRIICLKRVLGLGLS